MIIRYMRISANISYFVLFEGDAFVEGLGAFVAFGEEVEADALDVLLGAEVLEVVCFFAETVSGAPSNATGADRKESKDGEPSQDQH